MVHSLKKCCTFTLIQYRHCLGDIGYLDVEGLQDILFHCTPEELDRIEQATEEGSNRDICWYTWHFWLNLYRVKFGAPRDDIKVPPLPGPCPEDYIPPKGDLPEPGDWKATFMAKQQATKDKLEKLSGRIKQVYNAKQQEKAAKQAQVCQGTLPSRKRAMSRPSEPPLKRAAPAPKDKKGKMLKTLGIGPRNPRIPTKVTVVQRSIPRPPPPPPVHRSPLLANRHPPSGPTRIPYTNSTYSSSSRPTTGAAVLLANKAPANLPNPARSPVTGAGVRTGSPGLRPSGERPSGQRPSGERSSGERPSGRPVGGPQSPMSRTLVGGSSSEAAPTGSTRKWGTPGISGCVASPETQQRGSQGAGGSGSGSGSGGSLKSVAAGAAGERGTNTLGSAGTSRAAGSHSSSSSNISNKAARMAGAGGAKPSRGANAELMTELPRRKATPAAVRGGGREGLQVLVDDDEW